MGNFLRNFKYYLIDYAKDVLENILDVLKALIIVITFFGIGILWYFVAKYAAEQEGIVWLILVICFPLFFIIFFPRRLL